MRRLLDSWAMCSPWYRHSPRFRTGVWLYPWPGDWEIGVYAVTAYLSDGARIYGFCLGPLTIQYHSNVYGHGVPDRNWYWPK